MDERVEDVDGDVLSALSNIPPRRKIQSFSQQLRGEKGRSVVAGVDGIEIVTGGSSSAHHPIRRRNTTGSANTRLTRNHSLEEDRINKLIERRSCYNNDSSDDDIFPSASSTSGQGYYIGGSCNNYATTASTTDFLDRIPSNGSSIDKNQLQHQKPAQPIPEFVATGGGKGIFNVPKRGAMHPRRPPSIELRPHPLRETQVGSFLRVIVCTQSQLWAGEEHGVRFWNFSDAYATGSSKYRRGDEDAAPFCESSPTSPTICMVVDSGSKLVWSGHQDGKIRLWKMDQSLQEGKNGFEEGLSWRASRGPILSMAMTSYGDLWSGTEAGIIKVWPWETIDKSLCLTDNERNVSSLLVERSYIDLRTQVTVNGVCPIPNSDVKYMLSDSSRAKVWSAGSHSFVLWDGRTRDLLKVFNVDGQIENNRIDMSANQEPVVEDEMKVKFVSSSSSKKEKSQSSLNFFQRSRNALIGAADAVRRVATKGGFGDDNRKIEALVQTADGMIWVGCSNGSLAQWDGNGNRIQEFNHHHSCVQCLCAFGDRLWVGYVTGTIQVLDLEGNLIGGWVAHESPIIKMAAGAGYIFTLANHGGIRGWNIISPGLLDNILRTEVSSKQSEYIKMGSLNILIGTWNVGQGKPSHDSLIMWLGSAVSDVGLVIVGLQEVEMGAGFLAMSAARESVGLEGSSIGHSWLDTIGKNLDEGTTFELIGSRQLAGLLIAAWVRKNHRPFVGDVDAAAVPCGFGRAIGNKGGVGLRIRVYDRLLCFVNCHLAAHLDAVNRRNADFDHIYRNMVFNRPNLNASAGGTSTQVLRGTNAVGNSEDGKPELSQADMVVFLGDFNYRLYGITYEEAKDFVSQRCFDWLRERDQLRAEMKAGKVFQGMREGVVTFPPTYKFERHQPGLGGYDSSEKKRIPAWCDRIIYRDSRSAAMSKCNLDCPVVSSVLQYEACMDVTDSDHKPVRCMLNVHIACIDESRRRHEFGEIIGSNQEIRSMLDELYEVPETTVSTNHIILQNQDQSVLQIINKCESERAFFEIICESQSTVKEDGQSSEHRPRGSFGFPRWLEVTPAVGVIKPGKLVEVLVNHEEFHTLEEFVDGIPQNWWCEDTRDKEVTLALSIRGSLSTATKVHRIRVCHRFASSNNNSMRSNSTITKSKRTRSSNLQRFEHSQINCSPDPNDSQYNLHSPR